MAFFRLNHQRREAVMNISSRQQEVQGAGSEAKAFVLISAVVIPLLTILGIFGYGFAVWVMQILNGPPGHL
jgi:nitrate reductase NapE